jgi:HB1, ASXL, restriction endonuclease HTH domain
MTAKAKTAKQTPSNKSPKTAPAAKGKPAKKAPSGKAGPTKKLSAIAAAARVLTETGREMTCPELIEAMAAKRYWTSPGGKTPASTLYASIYQEIKTKGKDARFRKTERGKFAATGVA